MEHAARAGQLEPNGEARAGVSYRPDELGQGRAEPPAPAWLDLARVLKGIAARHADELHQRAGAAPWPGASTPPRPPATPAPASGSVPTPRSQATPVDPAIERSAGSTP